MKSKYDYKVVESAVYLVNPFNKKRLVKLNDQIAEQGEEGWDFYRDIGRSGLVFRRLREN